jgi:hypothetical protein
LATVLPQVLVAHDWESARTSIAAYLAHLRPTYAVRAVCPLELEAVLVADTGSSVVVCKDLTETIAVHARGWVVLSLEGPNEAIVGVGDERSIIKAPDFDDVVTAIDGLLARFDSGVTVTPC